MDRRDFLKASLFYAALFTFGRGPARAEAVPIPGKDPRMIVHSPRFAVMETPLELLRKYEITPKEILFTRNHFPIVGPNSFMATLSPIIDDSWSVRVTGLVERPGKITVGELKKMDMVEITCVLQCSGNGRAFYAKKAKTPGTQWKYGGMGNVRWKGVRLSDVLDYLSVKPSRFVRFITADGKDRPLIRRGPDFVHSVPFHDAVRRAILAVEMNGEPIPAVHGGPVRLVIPGYYGTMNIKWLTEICLTHVETPSKFQQKAYRVPLFPVKPGELSPRQFTPKNSRPNWRMRTKSVIFFPREFDRVKSGNVKVRGVAFNDGTVPIREVYVSADRGNSWLRAKIVKDYGPYGWYFWEADLRLRKGKVELLSRAIDDWGRGQPLDGTSRWNPKGYEWNGVDRVELEVV